MRRQRGCLETEMETETETRHVMTQRNEARASSGLARSAPAPPCTAVALPNAIYVPMEAALSATTATPSPEPAAHICRRFQEQTQAGQTQCPHRLLASSLSLGNKMNYMLLQAAASLVDDDDDCSGHLRPVGACR